ncbi:MAG: double zinc ribbon domain-containing protein [bacterium]
MSENLCQCRACDEWISGDAHVCPKCGEMFQIFSCSECESDITENASVCPSCGKKYILNLWFNRSYWILSIPFFIIVSAFILTIIYPLSDSTPISK